MFYPHRSAFLLMHVRANMTRVERVGCNVQAVCAHADSSIEAYTRQAVSVGYCKLTSLWLQYKHN